MENNNQMLSFKDMINNFFKKYDIYIPLIQRNYKWNSSTAIKLASDLWEACKKNQSTYTIGMITFYEEEGKKLQLIDGQQRMISLFILLKFLEDTIEKTFERKVEEKTTDSFTFNFERDECISSDKQKRISYLKDITNNKKWKKEDLYTDVNRFIDNYEAIKKELILKYFKDIIEKIIEKTTDSFEVNDEAIKEIFESTKIEEIKNILKKYRIKYRIKYIFNHYEDKVYEKIANFIYNEIENKNIITESIKKTDEIYDRLKEFIEYIKNKIYFLVHMSETEPFDEFMNLNNHKTRFVISDKIKAKLIIDSQKNEIENKKEDVVKLFQELSKELFTNNIWELVSQGYCNKEILEENSKREKNKHYPDENRLKLLCSERYDSEELDINYEFDKEFKILNHYKNILEILSKDIECGNWNSYNAFNCLHSLTNIRFFELLKESKEPVLEKYFLTKMEKLDNFDKSCFIESQLANKKIKYDNSKNKELEYIKNNKIIQDKFEEDNKENELEWFNNGSSEWNIFKDVYNTYIEQKYNKE